MFICFFNEFGRDLILSHLNYQLQGGTHWTQWGLVLGEVLKSLWNLERLYIWWIPSTKHLIFTKFLSLINVNCGQKWYSHRLHKFCRVVFLPFTGKIAIFLWFALPKLWIFQRTVVMLCLQRFLVWALVSLDNNFLFKRLLLMVVGLNIIWLKAFSSLISVTHQAVRIISDGPHHIIIYKNAKEVKRVAWTWILEQEIPW